MSNFNLSICVPSNRNYVESRESISSAINFCDLTNSEVVVSDNSNDIKKSNFWNNLNLNFFKYDSEAPSESISNWCNAINKSEGLYAGILSDDDLILNIDKSATDYKEVFDNDVMGIKPAIQLWTESAGIYKINNFNITENTAKLRLANYINNNKGDNTTLYSFFNKSVFLDLLKLSLFHPTKGGFVDWAFVNGLVSSGKILYDASKLLLYKNTKWSGNQEVIDAALYIYEELLLCFLNEVKKNEKNFRDYEKELIYKIYRVNHIEEKLELSLNIIECLDSELSQKYKIFYKKAIGYDWGVIK